MPGFLRWTGRILLGLIVLLAVGAVVVYALSARILTAPADVTGSAFAILDDSASVAEGKRLATTRGCNGCHGEDTRGRVMVDHPVLGRLIAPSLPELARREPPEQIERAIRRGIGIDGRALLVMPSEMYYDLSDTDLGRIVGWLRSIPVESAELPGRSLRLARLLLVTKRFQPAYASIPPGRSRFGSPAPGDTLRLGEYVARTSCPECHGLDLMGGDDTPSLALVAGYTPEEFNELMRTGIAKGGRELGLMSDIAQSRLSHLNNDEVIGLRRFLTSLAGAAP